MKALKKTDPIFVLGFPSGVPAKIDDGAQVIEPRSATLDYFKLNSAGVRRPSRQSPYQLLVQLGRESLMREAIAGFGEQQVTVWRFQYVPDSYSSLEREQMLKQLELLQLQEESAAAPMLQQAQAATGPLRQRILQTIVQTYPHTDAAIEAMQLMEGEVVKRASNR